MFMGMTYGSYLQLNKILDAQKLESPDEHDETLFIIIHQVYELWFKQMLHEAEYLRESLLKSNSNQASQTLRRMLKILKTMVSQVDVIETMTPLSFQSFRSYLKSSSGFQSIQFRKFEVALGKRSSALLSQLPQDEVNSSGLKTDLTKPSIFDCFLVMAKDRGFDIPQKVLDRDFTEEYIGNNEVQRAILSIYRLGGELSFLCESLIDMDEGIQEWRYRHVKMVERTIGHQKGTGGSAGVEYLKSTLFKPFFPDLWQVRSEF